MSSIPQSRRAEIRPWNLSRTRSRSLTEWLFVCLSRFKLNIYMANPSNKTLVTPFIACAVLALPPGLYSATAPHVRVSVAMIIIHKRWKRNIRITHTGVGCVRVVTVFQGVFVTAPLRTVAIARIDMQMQPALIHCYRLMVATS